MSSPWAGMTGGRGSGGKKASGGRGKKAGGRGGARRGSRGRGAQQKASPPAQQFGGGGAPSSGTPAAFGGGSGGGGFSSSGGFVSPGSGSAGFGFGGKKAAASAAFGGGKKASPGFGAGSSGGFAAASGSGGFGGGATSAFGGVTASAFSAKNSGFGVVKAEGFGAQVAAAKKQAGFGPAAGGRGGGARAKPRVVRKHLDAAPPAGGGGAADGGVDLRKMLRNQRRKQAGGGPAPSPPRGSGHERLRILEVQGNRKDGQKVPGRQEDAEGRWSAFFEQYGPVENVTTRPSKRLVRVRFVTAEAASEASQQPQAIQKHFMCQKRVNVKVIPLPEAKLKPAPGVSSDQGQQMFSCGDCGNCAECQEPRYDQQQGQGKEQDESGADADADAVEECSGAEQPDLSHFVPQEDSDGEPSAPPLIVFNRGQHLHCPDADEQDAGGSSGQAGDGQAGAASSGQGQFSPVAWGAQASAPSLSAQAPASAPHIVSAVPVPRPVAARAPVALPASAPVARLSTAAAMPYQRPQQLPRQRDKKGTEREAGCNETSPCLAECCCRSGASKCEVSRSTKAYQEGQCPACSTQLFKIKPYARAAAGMAVKDSDVLTPSAIESAVGTLVSCCILGREPSPEHRVAVSDSAQYAGQTELDTWRIEKYNFIADRFRMVRKDLTTQRYTPFSPKDVALSEAAIFSLERMARFFIHSSLELGHIPKHNPFGGVSFSHSLNTKYIKASLEDLSEHHNKLHGEGWQLANRPEMEGYRLLMAAMPMYSGETTKIIQTIASQDSALLKDEKVEFGLKMTRFVRSGDFASFFKLLDTADYFQAAILHAPTNAITYMRRCAVKRMALHGGFAKLAEYTLPVERAKRLLHCSDEELLDIPIYDYAINADSLNAEFKERDPHNTGFVADGDVRQVLDRQEIELETTPEAGDHAAEVERLVALASPQADGRICIDSFVMKLRDEKYNKSGSKHLRKVATISGSTITISMVTIGKIKAAQISFADADKPLVLLPFAQALSLRPAVRDLPKSVAGSSDWTPAPRAPLAQAQMAKVALRRPVAPVPVPVAAPRPQVAMQPPQPAAPEPADIVQRREKLREVRELYRELGQRVDEEVNEDMALELLETVRSQLRDDVRQAKLAAQAKVEQARQAKQAEKARVSKVAEDARQANAAEEARRREEAAQAARVAAAEKAAAEKAACVAAEAAAARAAAAAKRAADEAAARKKAEEDALVRKMKVAMRFRHWKRIVAAIHECKAVETQRREAFQRVFGASNNRADARGGTRRKRKAVLGGAANSPQLRQRVGDFGARIQQQAAEQRASELAQRQAAERAAAREKSKRKLLKLQEQERLQQEDIREQLSRKQRASTPGAELAVVPAREPPAPIMPAARAAAGGDMATVPFDMRDDIVAEMAASDALTRRLFEALHC